MDSCTSAIVSLRLPTTDSMFVLFCCCCRRVDTLSMQLDDGSKSELGILEKLNGFCFCFLSSTRRKTLQKIVIKACGYRTQDWLSKTFEDSTKNPYLIKAKWNYLCLQWQVDFMFQFMHSNCKATFATPLPFNIPQAIARILFQQYLRASRRNYATSFHRQQGCP